jgi:hypothetical protein
MGPIYIGFFHIFVDCLLLFFLCIVSSCALFCLVLLMDGFSSLFWLVRGRYVIDIETDIKLLQDSYCLKSYQPGGV